MPSLSKYIDEQKTNKFMLKKLTLDLEIYENDYYNLGEDVCNEKIEVINSKIAETKVSIKKYKSNYNKLNDEEKFVVDELYKGIQVKELALFYSNNQDRAKNISPYKKSRCEKFKSHTIKKYLFKFEKNILKKLEMSKE